MTKIKDTLCDLSSSDINKYQKEILKEVTAPKYICKKCVRVSNSKDLLCKPQKIKSITN